MKMSAAATRPGRTSRNHRILILSSIAMLPVEARGGDELPIRLRDGQLVFGLRLRGETGGYGYAVTLTMHSMTPLRPLATFPARSTLQRDGGDLPASRAPMRRRCASRRSPSIGRSPTPIRSASCDACGKCCVRQMIVFFRILVYNFCLSGIALCPFVLAPTRRPDTAAAPGPPLRRCAAPPASEANEAPPTSPPLASP